MEIGICEEWWCHSTQNPIESLEIKFALFSGVCIPNFPHNWQVLCRMTSSLSTNCSAPSIVNFVHTNPSQSKVQKFLRIQFGMWKWRLVVSSCTVSIWTPITATRSWRALLHKRPDFGQVLCTNFLLCKVPIIIRIWKDYGIIRIIQFDKFELCCTLHASTTFESEKVPVFQ